MSFLMVVGDTIYEAMLEAKKVYMCSLHEPLVFTLHNPCLQHSTCLKKEIQGSVRIWTLHVAEFIFKLE